ncbi:MAG TPA: tetratricopeptide repeat protein [Leeuwenhoekiella sp.]|nr:tetratricopeptide repeat protein [Leeuwenhoekiella sp.]
MQKLLFLICVSCFFKAEAQNPSALAIADSLYAVGNYNEALTNYSTIQPKNQAIYLKIARAHQAKGVLGNALANYKKAATGPEAAVALNEYGKLLITTAHYKMADSVFTVLIATYKDNPNFYYQRGRAKMQIPDTTSRVNTDSLTSKNDLNTPFITDFEQAVALDSTHQKALYQTAKYYLKRKNFMVVERLCAKALQSYPENVEIISLLAQDNFSRGFVSDAIPLFEKLLELGQNSQFIYEKLGVCYYKRRKYDKAIDAYLKALVFSKEDFHLHENLAKLYNFIEDFKNAEKHGKLAIVYKDLPLDADYYTLGNTYKIHKKWKKAMANYNKALSENEDHKKALYYKAVVADNYYEDKREVLKLYEKFIDNYENGQYAKYDPLLRLARDRRAMLNEEIFMAKGN